MFDGTSRRWSGACYWCLTQGLVLTGCCCSNWAGNRLLLPARGQTLGGVCSCPQPPYSPVQCPGGKGCPPSPSLESAAGSAPGHLHSLQTRRQTRSFRHEQDQSTQEAVESKRRLLPQEPESTADTALTKRFSLASPFFTPGATTLNMEEDKEGGRQGPHSCSGNSTTDAASPYS